MRGTAASDINALVQYQNWSIENAASEVVQGKLPELGGTGGVIALNRQGQFASPHSSQNLLYGYVTEADEIVIDLFQEKATENRLAGLKSSSNLMIGFGNRYVV